jgi:hypothetical protein
MSDCPDALSAEPLPQPIGARAARLRKFKREQRIVDYLNRGVSVAEIAARIGVGEKRLRAMIREILARRMPHPPEEFVAIQMSRLNEALLVAFSAMSTTNLKAVDQVVKIVRELDRYGGAFAAEWARPAASRLEAPEEADVAFAKAWLSGGELADEAGDERPEIPWQDLEKIESAPGNPLALQSPLGDGRPSTPYERGEGPQQFAADGARADDRNCEGAPAPLVLSLSTDVPESSNDPAHSTILRQAQDEVGVMITPPITQLDGRGRPEILAQGLEKIDSAPGNVDAAQDRSPPQDAAPALAPEPNDREGAPSAPTDPTLSRGANGRGCGPAQPLAFGHRERPENPAQAPDKIDSAPEIAGPAAVPNDVSLILTPTGWKPMRMPLNGVAA